MGARTGRTIPHTPRPGPRRGFPPLGQAQRHATPIRWPGQGGPPGRRSEQAAMNRQGLVIKLQIAAAVFVPMLALGLWLTSKGFFG